MLAILLLVLIGLLNDASASSLPAPARLEKRFATCALSVTIGGFGMTGSRFTLEASNGMIYAADLVPGDPGLLPVAAFTNGAQLQRFQQHLYTSTIVAFSGHVNGIVVNFTIRLLYNNLNEFKLFYVTKASLDHVPTLDFTAGMSCGGPVWQPSDFHCTVDNLDTC
ncbi:uncharacterized protein L969DRAFT_497804 [Mixia osmundae IAM 14324]|uniref:Uncharacterized protein n=1 Tax=Mixia osmundae (strain CBS 9802 / IAM 14324 / JCM 22182 / KY 12970) TaxID=764103 RepID=G7E7D7_MIXOS|nr:uncharacterized protein L969DRAFT_497804 [Mixia osmundae IAM 14324]KEI38906.1 hypothetical protein L969DRAFT_497804 [Mixia osmundae IAM 14324]GAA98747.1 hypothetical protein E5Q_05435 [Mixia osmundae IAM 14324]